MMTNRAALGRTHMSVDLRTAKVRAQGHTFTMTGDRTQFTAALRRTDGTRQVVTITPDDLSESAKVSPVFQAYPQQVLMNTALHALCDWNDEQNKAAADLTTD